MILFNPFRVDLPVSFLPRISSGVINILALRATAQFYPVCTIIANNWLLAISLNGCFFNCCIFKIKASVHHCSKHAGLSKRSYLKNGGIKNCCGKT